MGDLDLRPWDHLGMALACLTGGPASERSSHAVARLGGRPPPWHRAVPLAYTLPNRRLSPSKVHGTRDNGRFF